MGSTLKTIDQQQQNQSLRTKSSLSYRGGGGFKAFYWRQIFVLDPVVVKTQNCLDRMEASLLTQCIITEKHSNKRPMTHR